MSLHCSGPMNISGGTMCEGLKCVVCVEQEKLL